MHFCLEMEWLTWYFCYFSLFWQLVGYVQSKECDTDIWKEFASGNFSVNKHEIPFCSIGVDKTDE